MDAAFGFITTVLAFLSEKYGIVGVILAYALAIAPIVSALIEILEAVVLVTESKKDDEVAAKIRAVWSKVLPYLELLPHVNLPVAPVIAKVLGYVLKGVSAIKGALAGWFAKPPQQ
jgi:phage-related protein